MRRNSESETSMFTCLDFTHPKPNPNKKKCLPKIETPNVFNKDPNKKKLFPKT